MTAYVVLKLAYATSQDLKLGSDPQRAFPRLPPPPFVFQRQSDAVERASVLAARLLSYEAATVEFIVLETKQAFRATIEERPPPALIEPPQEGPPPLRAPETGPPPLPTEMAASNPPGAAAAEGRHDEEDENILADALMLALKDDG